MTMQKKAPPTPGEMWRAGKFKSDDEARGAFRLAHEQWRVGAALRIAGNDTHGFPAALTTHMGLTMDELTSWHHDESLPSLR